LAADGSDVLNLEVSKMLTDCKWLLSNLAEGLQRFALLDDHNLDAYLRHENGLFHAIGNGAVNSPHVMLVDDGRVEWGTDSLNSITSELREQGLMRDGENLRRELESLLTAVDQFQTIAAPKLKSASRPTTLLTALGEPLCNYAIELQQRAESLLQTVLQIWKKLPADEAVTATQLSEFTMKFVKGNWRAATAREVLRELGKPGAPKPSHEEECKTLRGKTTKKWMRDSAMLYFDSLEGWRVS